MIEIICDDRETRVYAAALDLYDNFSSKHLTTGDFLICYNRGDIKVPLVVIERKTWPDLAASIKDGRCKNIEKLNAYREETGARVGYLLEGAPPKAGQEGSKYGVPYKNMRAHLDHLLYRDNIIELSSANATASAMRLFEFASNLESVMQVADYARGDGVKEATKKIEKTPDQISDGIWSSFKGISIVSARAFRPLTIRDLYVGKLSKDDLSALKVGDKKFGPTRAAKVLEQLELDATFLNVLCAVPQISTKRAETILELARSGSKKEFFEEWNEEIITKAVGKSCASKLRKYLCGE